MRKVALLLIIGFYSCRLFAQQEIDYLGQDTPGMTPEIFAKGIVSSNHQEHSTLSISTDGNEMWWSIWELPRSSERVQKILYIKRDGDQWVGPRIAAFSGKYKEGGPFLSYDGNTLFFYSRRPIDLDTLEKDIDIWFVDRTENGWSEPVNAGSVINTEFVEANPVLVKNNNLYFTSNRLDGNPDIYLSRFINGKYIKPENIGDKINTPDAREMFFTVAPDESFIIFTRDSRKFSESGDLISGERNLMICFKDENGFWMQAINMGSVFNDKKARFPGLSPDGKYLFFTRYTEGNDEDIYWVDAKIIEELKDKIVQN